MKKVKLTKAKALSRENLKNVSGGQGGCIPAHFEYVGFDPEGVDSEGQKGVDVYKWVPKVC